MSLENIAEIYQPQTISQAECTKDGTFLVFGANGIIGKYNKYNHKEKQITISCRGENSGTINETPPYCWINGNSMVINIDNSEIIDKNYLKYILSAQNLKYLISGSGQPQIVRNGVLKHKIPIISIKEQLQFSNKFILIDNKIILENNKINKLQQLKKGLMQTMFV